MKRKIMAVLTALCVVLSIPFRAVWADEAEPKYVYFNGPVKIELEAVSNAAEIDYFTWSFVNLDGSVSEYRDIRAEAFAAEEPGHFKGEAVIPETDGLMGYVVFTATDMSGNESAPVFRKDEIIVTDMTAPVIKVAESEPVPVNTLEGMEYYGAARIVTLEITEPNFDPTLARITVAQKDICGEDLEDTYALSEWESEGSVHRIKIRFTGDAIYSLTASCTDLAGNESEAFEEVRFTVDTTPPEGLNITYSKAESEDEEALYYNDGMQVTMMGMEDISEISTFRYRYFDQDERKSCSGEITDGIISVGRNYYAVLDFPGEWEQMKGCFEFQTVNTAGHESCWFSDSRKVVTDSIAPFMKLEADAPYQSIEGTDYYGQAAHFTLRIDEANFHSADVMIRAEKDGTAEYIQPVWTDNECSFELAEDGRYRLLIDYSDRSGNAMDSFVSRDIVIDTEIMEPEVLLNGEDSTGGMYSGEIIPSVFFEDENFDSCDIELLQVKIYGLEDVSGHTERFLDVNEHGFKGILDLFEEISENDGIYELTVLASDLAGHVSERKVDFTVNRFGSVFVFDDAIKNVSGKYLQSIDKDLFVTVYNPGEITECRIDVTRDGKPVQYDEDIRKIKKDGWNAYLCNIINKIFIEDGLYKVKIITEDTAGNISETYLEEISFCVDNTPPEIVNIDGLSQKIINTQEQEIRFQAFDSRALEEIRIYLDDILIEKISDFEDPNFYEGRLVIGEDPAERHIRFLVKDKAGNLTDTDADDFRPAYDFNPRVTISSDFFVRWFADKEIFFGSMAAIGGTAALIILGIKKLRKSK